MHCEDKRIYDLQLIKLAHDVSSLGLKCYNDHVGHSAGMITLDPLMGLLNKSSAAELFRTFFHSVGLK